ncbi:RNA polymerase sigma factor [Sinanaerobacter sp. ZZT-01]|uniref:RNA polymerase sigma factor n=1 Tax=Sinanaerobacter sp. ZZT-01 TaxID=3111540 RepID=UPI002D7A1AA7|nr:RNA polymerase sigma factor [Sinanaerobacter sp. ZZT-01]WRR92161.1 RNA polymerase sigma factor [Sinanaerobacter sp. ZZT-01]
MKLTDIDEMVYIEGKALYNFCRHLTQDKEEAEELYQETFLKAVELCSKIDVEKNPKSYLMSIAVKLWKNRKRKFAWRSRIAFIQSSKDESAREENLFGEVHSPEDELLKKEKQRIVSDAVKELKEAYRTPMYLYYAEEMPLREISLILHLPEGTVKSRLYKARKEIKKYLEVNGYGR